MQRPCGHTSEDPDFSCDVCLRLNLHNQKLAFKGIGSTYGYGEINYKYKPFDEWSKERLKELKIQDLTILFG